MHRWAIKLAILLKASTFEIQIKIVVESKHNSLEQYCQQHCLMCKLALTLHKAYVVGCTVVTQGREGVKNLLKYRYIIGEYPLRECSFGMVILLLLKQTQTIKAQRSFAKLAKFHAHLSFGLSKHLFELGVGF